jgi:hypothetical protein
MARNAFYHRERQLADLTTLTRHADRPAMVLVYGRRRVGKSTLLREWSRRSALPMFYWESPRGNGEFVLNRFMTELYAWAGEPVVESRPPSTGVNAHLSRAKQSGAMSRPATRCWRNWMRQQAK